MLKSHPKYVRLFKSRRIAAIITGISSIGCVVLILVAFLGRKLGSFTAKMNEKLSDVRLDTTCEFLNPTSFLKVDGMLPFTPETNSKLNDHNKIDNEQTTFKDVAKFFPGDTMNCFKFTFFIKNLGESAASFDLSFNVEDLKRPDNRQDALDDVLRVRWYKNDGNDKNSHDFKTYAKMKRTITGQEDGNFRQEYIDPRRKETGLAEMFLYDEYVPGDSKILEENRVLLSPAQIIRYTALVWLEGNDPECEGDLPHNASIKLGIDIEASEMTSDKSEA